MFVCALISLTHTHTHPSSLSVTQSVAITHSPRSAAQSRDALPVTNLCSHTPRLTVRSSHSLRHWTHTFSAASEAQKKEESERKREYQNKAGADLERRFRESHNQVRPAFFSFYTL
ncbi:hypothetical protein ILYODFUR_016427 [Ilyodon furcidens]|uniref:Gla-rich protein n=1 Tax=Ilyodon furcidens TaxID=33524 RepID=A0ABV0UKS3_9TELE